MERQEFEVSGLWFDEDCPRDLAQVIAGLVHTGKRVHAFTGDLKTGIEWGDEFEVTGTVGKSTGSKPIPLMIANRNSTGGPAFFTSIVKLVDTKSGRVLWQHPNYKPAVYELGTPPERIGNTDMRKEGYTTAVYRTDRGERDNVANFKNESSARNWIAFMQGKRGTK